MLEGGLHWEMRSGRRRQYCWRSGRWACRRTLGGIRVERARRWMKLILTAALQLASIALFRRAALPRDTHLGWQDDGVGMEIVRSVRMSRIKAASSAAASSAKHRIPELDIRRHHHRSRRTSPQRLRRHNVRRAQVNWRPPARTRPATLCHTIARPRIPHIRDQRAHSPQPPDVLGRCARRPPQERLHPDQEGERRRGHEARPRLQRRCRLPDFVRSPSAQPIKG